MSKYGDGVTEPYSFSGSVIVRLDEPFTGRAAAVSLDPDEARLLAARLVRMADEAEGQEW